MNFLRKLKLWLDLRYSIIENIEFNDHYKNLTIIERNINNIKFSTASYTYLFKRGSLNLFYKRFSTTDWYNEKDIQNEGAQIIIAGNKIPVYDKNGKKIRRAIWKYVFNGNISQLTGIKIIDDIIKVKSDNEYLLSKIKTEQENLKKDKQNYIYAGMEEQYQKTADVLLMNVALIDSRLSAIDMALTKAKKINNEITNIDAFIKRLEIRERNIKDISSANIELHAKTASHLHLIDDKVKSIRMLKDICDGITPIMDEHKVEQIKEAIRLTNDDFTNVYELVLNQ